MDERPRAKNPDDREPSASSRASRAGGARGGAGATERSGRGEVREIGSVIANRYVLKRHLGAGRYGEIYEAVDRTLSDPQLRVEQTVALHLLHPHVAKHTRLLQKLETSYHAPHLWAHPNVLKLSGFGVDGGRYFLVSELLEGASLRSLLDSVPAERRADADKLAVLRGVGDALKYAHGNGVVHGDVRPEKIFVTTEGVVKVLDLLPASSPRTRPYFVEDSDPKSAAVLDKRDDVYGLAAVAYELWQGQRPFEGSSPLEATRTRAMLTPIPNLPPNQWDALARALRLRREHRTADIAEFLADFGVTGSASMRTAPEIKDEEPEQPKYPRDDDMPIIGDYSHRVLDVAAMEQSLQAESAAPAPLAAATATRDPDSLRVDPRDMHRYAKRSRRADGKPFVAAATWLVVALLVAGVGVAVYLNAGPLRERADQWLAAIRGAASDAATSVITPSGSSGEEVVEAPVVVEARDIPPDVAPAAPEQAPAESALPRPVTVLPPAQQPAVSVAPAPAPAAPEAAASERPTEPVEPPAVEPPAAEQTAAPVPEPLAADEVAPPSVVEPGALEAVAPVQPPPETEPAVVDAPAPSAEPAQADAAAIGAPAGEPPAVVAAPPAPVAETPPVEAAAAAAVPAPEPEVVAPVAPPPPPPPPPEPESFEVSVRTVTVSEREAGARITVRRRGGTLGESAIVWWTEDGTAAAGNDYADLGMSTERFASGEATRTIYVPIIGDAARESTETFFVNLDLNTPASERLEPIVRVEVSVTDDD